MAMYHFRLKSDKKPNGTKISAVKHVDYIRREGAYSEQTDWQAKTKFTGNVITTAEIPNALGGQTALLYKTDEFGSIRNSANGIEVSENSSPTTISIALMLASETMNHQPLILQGSPEFKEAVLSAAVQDELEITFANPLLQTEFNHRKEELENERRKFVANSDVPTLSELAVVPPESEAVERKRLAKWTAQKILERIEETQDSVFAASHVEYINRERAFAQRGGCFFHSHHLPKWAKGDPKKFFRAADKYEGKGNR